jgi:hypothetical protein
MENYVNSQKEVFEQEIFHNLFVDFLIYFGNTRGWNLPIKIEDFKQELHKLVAIQQIVYPDGYNVDCSGTNTQ